MYFLYLYMYKHTYIILIYNQKHQIPWKEQIRSQGNLTSVPDTQRKIYGVPPNIEQLGTQINYGTRKSTAALATMKLTKGGGDMKISISE